MASARMPIMMTYRRFRAACSSSRLGWASVIRIGWVLRERAGSGFEVTSPFPPPDRSRMQDSADGLRLWGPSCHRSRGHAGVPQLVLAPRSGAGAGRLRGLLLLLLELADLGQRLGPGDAAPGPPGPLPAVAAGAPRQPGGVTPYCLPRRATKIFDFCAPKPGSSPIRFTSVAPSGTSSHSASARPP